MLSSLMHHVVLYEGGLRILGLTMKKRVYNFKIIFIC
jgi:hypothetical protein